MLSLLGPGGVGKTRLALEVMRQAGDDFAHGACFVSLASVREYPLVPFAVAQALGIQESGSLPVTELLADWLRSRHFLLVLDNLEQVIEAASPWLIDLLAACPRLKILATSRIALNIAGEQRFRVPTLPVPDQSRHRHPRQARSHLAHASRLLRDPGRHRLTNYASCD